MTPRVSTILSLLYPGSLDFVPQEALDRGTRLHAYMEGWVRHINQPERWASMDDFYTTEQKRLLASRQWVLDAGLEFVSAEKLYSSDLGFCGHPDLVAVWKHKLWVIDWKFADNISEQNLIQGEAYRHLVPNCHGVALVQCKMDATIQVHKLKKRHDLWAIFLNAKAVHQWRNR